MAVSSDDRVSFLVIYVCLFGACAKKKDMCVLEGKQQCIAKNDGRWEANQRQRLPFQELTPCSSSQQVCMSASNKHS